MPWIAFEWRSLVRALGEHASLTPHNSEAGLHLSVFLPRGVDDRCTRTRSRCAVPNAPLHRSRLHVPREPRLFFPRFRRGLAAVLLRDQHVDRRHDEQGEACLACADAFGAQRDSACHQSGSVTNRMPPSYSAENEQRAIILRVDPTVSSDRDRAVRRAE